MNLGIYIGRITKDLELKTTQGGVSYLQFSIAVQRDIKNANGEYDTDFIDCVAFRGAAEFLNNYAQKGYVVAVYGQMRDNNYRKEDGTMSYNKRFYVDQVDSTVLFLNRKHDDNQQNNQNYNQQQPQQQQPQQQQQQQGQAQPKQNGWQQQQQQNNPFNNANGPIDINDDDLPF